MTDLIKAARENDFISIAKIIGEPLDPKKANAKVIEAICDISITSAGEDLYKFDVDEDVKEVYVLADATGNVTSAQVTRLTESSVAFVDLASREYFVALYDLYRAKYDMLGKKKKAITRSLNAKEILMVLNVGLAAAAGAGNDLQSGAGEKFKYPDMVALLEKVQDYGDGFVLVCGAEIYHDMIMWDYDENKYHSLKDALADLGIERIRISGTADVATDGAGAVKLLDPKKALLVATNTEVGIRPLSFSRRELPADFIGLDETKDTAKQRITIVTPAVYPAGANRKPAVAIVAFESLAAVGTNGKAVASFEKTV